MIFFLILLILVSAFLSGSETALFSVSPLSQKTYAESSSPRLQLIARLMKRPRNVLVTILILNVLSNILIQNTVSAIFDDYQSLILKIFVPLALTLFLGELIPKSLALPNHAQIAYYVAPIIDRAARILRPIREPMTKATSFISRALFFFMKEEKEISSDELRHVLKTSEERGILMLVEAELISGTLDLQHSHMKEHMRPREEILAFDIHDPLSDLIDLFIEKEITRVPIYDNDLENLKGVLTAREFFFHRGKIEKTEDLLSILTKPYFIPETTRAWTALVNLRESGINLAIVVDEYGSISRLTTQEDLVEAVIGEIVDARDAKSLFTRSSEDVVIASGKLELGEFNDLFNASLKSQENIVTLGGWLVEQLGDIPTTGTKYATDNFLFYVLAADPNRIRRVYVRRLKK